MISPRASEVDMSADTSPQSSSSSLPPAPPHSLPGYLPWKDDLEMVSKFIDRKVGEGIHYFTLAQSNCNKKNFVTHLYSFAGENDLWQHTCTIIYCPLIIYMYLLSFLMTSGWTGTVLSSVYGRQSWTESSSGRLLASTTHRETWRCPPVCTWLLCSIRTKITAKTIVPISSC